MYVCIYVYILAFSSAFRAVWFSFRVTRKLDERD